MTTYITPAPEAVDSGAVKAQLEELLQDRQRVLRELEPRALPTIDPVAHQTAAAHRVVISEITGALNRLHAGSYGRCSRCGEQIASARLEAIPHAAACIRCQSHADAA